ncbi:hypothetical protein [Cetobacterium sp. ZWU0022]|uniref:hypothetical protein n=1 Tax=Cetobacterium sp. ZWU0022 TaxID=1340502 RepID=UPI0006469393|nr:hypothetical protein [Cetobacterium sp. ZWU0022]
MSKKIILLLASILSVGAFAHTIEFGFENEQYDSKYNTSDVFMPYVSGSITPEGSALKLDFKYLYQDQYGRERHTDSSKKFKTKRDRFELFASGYKYNNGNFTLTPKVGFRYEQWAIDGTSPYSQAKRYLNLRFYPDMTYKLSDSTNLYLSGFTGPAFAEVDKKSRLEETGSETYYGDWYQEVQLLGIRHRFSNKDSVWASIYNEYKYVEHSSEYMRWQLRVGYNMNLTDKLVVGPFGRFDLHYEEESLNKSKPSEYKKIKDKDETRIGTTFNYKVDSSLTVVGEIYWQTALDQKYGSSASSDKERMFYKLGLRKSF